MRQWFARQYNDIKGNLKFAILGLLWPILFPIIKHLLRLIPNIPSWAVWSILLLLSATAFVWIVKPQRQSSQGTAISQTAPVSLVTSDAKFDAPTFFRRAYQSPETAKVETNIRKAAADNQPNDKEGFYAKFIGVGLTMYIYDTLWFSIFKSQLLMLLELNRKNGWLTLAEVKSYYNQGAASTPAYYVNYTFDQWLDFMKSQLLIIVHPSNMVEITTKSKDFLKYLLHHGREPQTRSL